MLWLSENSKKHQGLQPCYDFVWLQSKLTMTTLTCWCLAAIMTTMFTILIFGASMLTLARLVFFFGFIITHPNVSYFTFLLPVFVFFLPLFSEYLWFSHCVFKAAFFSHSLVPFWFPDPCFSSVFLMCLSHGALCSVFSFHGLSLFPFCPLPLCCLHLGFRILGPANWYC